MILRRVEPVLGLDQVDEGPRYGAGDYFLPGEDVGVVEGGQLEAGPGGVFRPRPLARCGTSSLAGPPSGLAREARIEARLYLRSMSHLITRLSAAVEGC